MLSRLSRLRRVLVKKPNARRESAALRQGRAAPPYNSIKHEQTVISQALALQAVKPSTAKNIQDQNQSGVPKFGPKRFFHTKNLGLINYYNPNVDWTCVKPIDEQNKGQLLNSLSQTGYELGKSEAEGDWFFDALAQSLRNAKIKIPSEYQNKFGYKIQYQYHSEYKKLRQICANFAEKNKNIRPNWLRDAISNHHGDYQNYMETVGLTSSEMTEMKKVKFGCSLYVGWRAPEIDGRIICTVLDISIHIVNLHKNEGIINYQHQLIDSTGIRNIDETQAKQSYKQKRIIHLAVEGDNSLCYFPLIRQTLIHRFPILPRSLRYYYLKFFTNTFKLTNPQNGNSNSNQENRRKSTFWKWLGGGGLTMFIGYIIDIYVVEPPKRRKKIEDFYEEYVKSLKDTHDILLQATQTSSRLLFYTAYNVDQLKNKIGFLTISMNHNILSQTKLISAIADIKGETSDIIGEQIQRFMISIRGEKNSLTQLQNLLEQQQLLYAHMTTVRHMFRAMLLNKQERFDKALDEFEQVIHIYNNGKEDLDKPLAPYEYKKDSKLNNGAKEEYEKQQAKFWPKKEIMLSENEKAKWFLKQIYENALCQTGEIHRSIAQFNLQKYRIENLVEYTELTSNSDKMKKFSTMMDVQIDHFVKSYNYLQNAKELNPKNPDILHGVGNVLLKIALLLEEKVINYHQKENLFNFLVSPNYEEDYISILKKSSLFYHNEALKLKKGDIHDISVYTGLAHAIFINYKDAEKKDERNKKLDEAILLYEKALAKIKSMPNVDFEQLKNNVLEDLIAVRYIRYGFDAGESMSSRKNKVGTNTSLLKDSADALYIKALAQYSEKNLKSAANNLEKSTVHIQAIPYQRQWYRPYFNLFRDMPDLLKCMRTKDCKDTKIKNDKKGLDL